MSALTTDESAFLRRAIELAALAPPGSGDLPFGAVVVHEGGVIGQGRNQVAGRGDPTAHAEILALREAADHLHVPDLTGAVLYSSGEPCPMCLAACMWAGVSGIIYAATVEDAAAHGFRDQELYRQIASPNSRRALRIDAAPQAVRAEAVRTLDRWCAEQPDAAGENPA